MSMWLRTSTRRNQQIRNAFRQNQREGKLTTKDRSAAFQTPLPVALITLWLFFIGIGIYVFCFSPFLEITSVVVVGNQKISQPKVLAVAERLLNGFYWKIFSKKNIFFVPRGALEETLKQTYPLFDRVEITRVFPHQLEIRVAERSYLLLWCSGGPCYAVTSGQRAVGYAPDTQPETWQLAVVDTSALPVSVGESLEVQPYFSVFEQLTRLLPERLELSLQPEAYTPSRFSQELRVVTGAGWSIIVNTEIPVEDTLASLKAFLEHRSQGPQKDVPLSTIDLRVPGKVFYTEKAINNAPMVVESVDAAPLSQKKDAKHSDQGKKHSDK